MKRNGFDRQDDGYVSASELAEMAVCERRVWFDTTVGRAETQAQRQAKERGLQEHARFYQEAMAMAERPRGRCFIATQLLGPDDPDTEALRAFRDVVLRRGPAGRAFILWYYRTSPALCRGLRDMPRMTRVVEWCVRGIARCSRLIVKLRAGMGRP
jgi:hypothetical protein